MKNLIAFVLGRMLNTLAVIAPRYGGKIGFRIFCHPFRGKMQPYHHKFLNTATKSTLHHDGVDVQVYRWGKGEKKILFLHGWQSHTFRWKNYIEAFSGDDYTLIAIDAPGHGLSKGNMLTVPLYSEVIEKLILKEGEFEAIVGHSLGAFTTLYTFHRLPLLPVKRIVALASPGTANEFTHFFQSSLKLNEYTMKQVRRYFEEFVGERVEFFNAEKFAASITQAGLIIHDEGDEDTHYQYSIALNKAWKKSTLHLTKGLGHNLKSPMIIEEVVNFARMRERLEV